MQTSHFFLFVNSYWFYLIIDISKSYKNIMLFLLRFNLVLRSDLNEVKTRLDYSLFCHQGLIILWICVLHTYWEHNWLKMYVVNIQFTYSKFPMRPIKSSNTNIQPAIVDLAQLKQFVYCRIGKETRRPFVLSNRLKVFSIINCLLFVIQNRHNYLSFEKFPSNNRFHLF